MPFKDLEKRLTRLEEIMSTHLEESGSIRSDLAWLKKAFWTLVGLAMAALVARLFHF